MNTANFKKLLSIVLSYKCITIYGKCITIYGKCITIYGKCCASKFLWNQSCQGPTNNFYRLYRKKLEKYVETQGTFGNVVSGGSPHVRVDGDVTVVIITWSAAKCWSAMG